MQGIRIALKYVGSRMDIALFVVSGYVDTTTCQELSNRIQQLVQKKQYQIIVNLGGVTYISSAGWGVFMGEIKNVRDLGGDIKLVQMPAEVYEVFEMLEFNRILNHYETIEEAINEFDILRGIDITVVNEEARQGAENISNHDADIDSATLVDPRITEVEDTSSPEAGKLSIKDFPLTEKIKLIIIDNPLLSMNDIRKTLNTEQYGHVQLGFFKLRSILKQMSLNSKEKRYRFYRSR